MGWASRANKREKRAEPNPPDPQPTTRPQPKHYAIGRIGNRAAVLEILAGAAAVVGTPGPRRRK